MKSKSLANSNRYLKNKAKAQKLMVRSLASSTAIETGEPIHQLETKLKLLHSLVKRVKLA